MVAAKLAAPAAPPCMALPKEMEPACRSRRPAGSGDAHCVCAAARAGLLLRTSGRVCTLEAARPAGAVSWWLGAAWIAGWGGEDDSTVGHTAAGAAVAPVVAAAAAASGGAGVGGAATARDSGGLRVRTLLLGAPDRLICCAGLLPNTVGVGGLVCPGLPSVDAVWECVGRWMGEVGPTDQDSLVWVAGGGSWCVGVEGRGVAAHEQGCRAAEYLNAGQARAGGRQADGGAAGRCGAGRRDSGSQKREES